MKRITKIDAESGDRRKIKVAAYARVSTNSEEQLLSLQTQRMHYENFIQSNGDWEFAGLFYDEGLSGTKMTNRQGLLSMLDACEKGLIDRVITKSISRLSRNTTDCLSMIRKMSELGVSIYFEKENIDTASMESEMMLSVLSGMAESESVSISENTKWSVKRRYQNGTFKIVYPPYGYKYENEDMVIVPEEAEVVKRIFKETLSGNGSYLIAKGLNADGIPSKKNCKWSSSTIDAIIQNEKYVGDVLFQKTYTDDKFKRHKNSGERNMYYMQEHHEPIISRGDFERAQEIVSRRREEKGIEKGTGKYQKRYPFSGKLICGECGSTLKRRIVYRSDGNQIKWACFKHINDKSECSMISIKDEHITEAFVVMLGKLKTARRHIIVPLIKSLESIDGDYSISRISEVEDKLEAIETRKEILSELSNSGVLEPGVFAAENREIIDEENRLKEEKDRLSELYSKSASELSEAEKLNDILRRYKFTGEFDGEMFRKTISKVYIYSRTEAEFILKCGLRFRERLGD